MKKYEELYKKIKNDIESGVLVEGERLLSIREESISSLISKNTVIKAYDILVDEGLIVSRERGGYRVRTSALTVSKNGIGNKCNDTQSYTASGRETGERLDQIFDRLSRIDNTFACSTIGPDLLPVKELNITLKTLSTDWINYNDPKGDFDLRRKIAIINQEIDGFTTPEDLIITNGATEAINIVIRTLIKPGDRVALESPSYYNFFRQLAPLDVEIVEIPMESDGLNLKKLEEEHNKKPLKMIIVQPNVHNPTGITMSDKKKKKLIALAQEWNTFIINDDVHGDLYFGYMRPTNLTLYSDYKGIITVSSYSKNIAPGLRIGWIRSPFYADSFMDEKLRSSMDTSRVSQAIIKEYIGKRAHRRHLIKIKKDLEIRIDGYLNILSEILPEGSSIIRPTGGCLLWINFPKNIDTTRLFETLALQGLITAPGDIFSSSSYFNNCLRLNAGFKLTQQRIEALKKIR